MSNHPQQIEPHKTGRDLVLEKIKMNNLRKKRIESQQKMKLKEEIEASQKRINEMNKEKDKILAQFEIKLTKEAKEP